MKKLSLALIVAGVLASSQANAKTEGDYVGIDILRTSSKTKSNSNSAADAAYSDYYSHNKSDSAFGFGINYKHAFNFDGIFVAPGVFFERLGTESKVNYAPDGYGYYNQSVKIGNRYGAKFDLGYDVTDKFSAYVPLGMNLVSYEIDTQNYDNIKTSNTKRTGNESGYFYGLGFSHALTNNISLNAEYNRLSKLKLNSASGASSVSGGSIAADTTVQIFKFGVSYKF